MPPPPPPKPTAEGMAQQAQSIVNRIECSQITVSVSAGGVMTLRGFTGSPVKLQSAQQDLGKIVGVTRVESQVRAAPWPQCEAYLTLLLAGRDNGGMSISMPGKKNALLTDGERVAFDIKMPNNSGFVYVSYLQASGDAVPLVWGDHYTAGQTLKLGQGTTRFVISEPFGDELLMVITSPKRLFDIPAPGSDDRNFLSLLRQTLLQLPAAEQLDIRTSTLSIKTVKR